MPVGAQSQIAGGNLVSVGNTNMTFNIESSSTNLGTGESSQMSDITGSNSEDANLNPNQFTGPQQMMVGGGSEDGNNDFSKKIYKAKRFKP